MGWTVKGSDPNGAKRFSLLHTCTVWLWTHLASCPMGTWALAGVKHLWHGTEHPLPLGLYGWHVMRRPLPSLLYIYCFKMKII